MIKIVNTKETRNEETRYHIKINDDYITGFWHKREDGLAICLLKASKAVEENKTEAYMKFLKLLFQG